MALSGGSLLTVWAPGDVPQRVRVSGLQITVGVSTVGQLSCLIPSKDMPAYGFGAGWKSLRVRFDHSHFPVFSGTIEDDQPSSSARTVDLVAVSPAGTFAQRRLPATYQPIMATPGALVAGAIDSVSTRRHLDVDVGVTESGRPMSGDARADDLLGYIQAIAQASGQEWTDGTNDDGTTWFRFDRLAGEDKTDRIWIIEGVNCVDVTAPGSLRTVVNDLLAVGDDRPYAAAAKVIVTDDDSIAAYGRREGTIRYTGVTSEAGLDPAASADLDRLAVPPIGPSLRMRARHPLVAEIRPGDRVRLSSATANREMIFRALTMSLTDDGRIVTLTGEAAVVPEVWGPWGLLDFFILDESLLS